MTRKSKRELERDVERLSDDDDARMTTALLHKDPLTGEYFQDRRRGGDPVDPDELDVDHVYIVSDAIVMRREKAERQGRTIVGPAENESNPDADLVRVPAVEPDGAGGEEEA